MPENKKSKINQTRYEEKVLKQYKDLIHKLAYTNFNYYNKKYAYDDLIQEAQLATLKAIRTFDKSKNVKLITHIYNQINFRFSHYTRSDTGTIKIPSGVINDPSKNKPKIIDNQVFIDNPSLEPCYHLNFENNLIIDDCFKLINERQQKILKMIYLEGYTCDQVAQEFKISRQAVNFAANNALKIIRENYKENV